VVSLLLKEYGKLRRGCGREELHAAKEQLKGGMLIGLESSDSRMMKLARDEIYYGRTVPLKEIVAGIDRVTLGQMKDTASEVLVPRNATLVAIGKVTKRNIPEALRRVIG
ncbi:MAG: hypothetical protein V3W31_00345, partial [Thermodesulfobacteriota bacterium]